MLDVYISLESFKTKIMSNQLGSLYQSLFSSNNAYSRACENIADRLAEKLVDWKFTEVLHEREMGTLSANERLKEDEESIKHIPTTYKNFFEYLHTWEPLLIEEIKEQVYTNFIQNYFSNQINVNGIMRFPIREDATFGRLITLETILQLPNNHGVMKESGSDMSIVK